MSKEERKKLIRQGIQSENGLKLRVNPKAQITNATDAEKALAKAYGKRFIIPLDFEMLKRPFFPYGLKDDLEIEITLNKAEAIIISNGKPAIAAVAATAGRAAVAAVPAEAATGTYKLTNLRLEFDQVTNSDLTALMKREYQHFILPFERIHLHSTRRFKKSESCLEMNINAPAKSTTHVLLLCVDPAHRKSFAYQNEKFANPNITKISTAIEGIPNLLYSEGYKPEYFYQDIRKLFPHPSSIDEEGFITDKHAVVIDLRPSADSRIYGGGKRLRNMTQGISLQIERKSSTDNGELTMYVYVIQNAQLNISNQRFHSLEY